MMGKGLSTLEVSHHNPSFFFFRFTAVLIQWLFIICDERKLMSLFVATAQGYKISLEA
jgi:hypothetical protein